MTLRWVVEAIVDLCEAFALVGHQFGTVFEIRSSHLIKLRICWVRNGEGKSFEAIGR